MSNSERETVICLNDADADEGYFSFWTSEPAHFRRLCRRIGGREKLIACQSSVRDGHEASWDCRVPIEFFSSATFAIGKRRSKQLSTAQKQSLGERLKIARNLKNSQTVCKKIA